MAKAIKHITAGLLHIEILGTVPACPPGWRRGGREAKTSAAQQFYNDKCSWRELELRLAAGFGRGDWVLTVTYDQAHLPADKREAKDQTDQAAPVVAWLEDHRPVVKELERLLGEVRKQERRARDRIYTPKTSILEEDNQ